jgi:mannose-6-phosphate isomerase-like protein (cupin superfamily)
MSVLNLETTFLALEGQGAVNKLPVGPDFWQTLGANPKASGTLVTLGRQEADWTNWEMHPHGDEVLFQLDGEVEVIFERAGDNESNVLCAGDALVVPAGTWHTAKVRTPGRMLFMTFGRGTQHKGVAA